MSDQDIEEIAKRVIRPTPEGVLAGAFSLLVEDATTEGRNWWRNSPLLSGIGLAHHLRELGHKVVPIPEDER